MKEKLFKIALHYIEKEYNSEQLRDGDDLYNSTIEEKDKCVNYFYEIQENGTKWAKEQFKKPSNITQDDIDEELAKYL
jgi:hypothetical protein